MSRVGKYPVAIPSGVNVSLADNVLTAKGKLGELTVPFTDDVTVEMKDSVLTIRGEKRAEREEKKEQSRWVERSYGSFSRSFTLPANAASDRVKAEFKDGVLTIQVPKAEDAKPKVISIK